MYCKINLESWQIIGRGELPKDLVGLPQRILNAPQDHLDPCQPDFRGVGFWLIQPAAAPPYDPATHRLSDEEEAIPDPDTHTVIVSPRVVALTGDEIAERITARRTELVAETKAEAGRLITAACPDWKQRNLTARAAELAIKGQANWTTAELAEWEAGQKVWDHIKAIRAASDVIEAWITDASRSLGGLLSLDGMPPWPSR